MGQFSSIGRIYQISPSAKNAELYFLRSLLTRRPGMASFDELRTYEGIIYNSFKETIKAMGLLKDDTEWKECLQEMSSSTTNRRLLRENFVLILIYNTPSDPRELWETFKDKFCDDYRRRRIDANGHLPLNDPFTDDDIDSALHHIADILKQPFYGKTLTNFNLPEPIKTKAELLPVYLNAVDNFAANSYEFNNNSNIGQEAPIDIDDERMKCENMCASMNLQQRAIMETLKTALIDIKNKNTAKCYFIDAPGGTGKTFILNAFIHHCRANNINVIVTAYSGAAANLLLFGRTCHSSFKFPLNQDTRDCSTGHLKPTEKAGRDLYFAEVIILDECPCLHRKLWELLHSSCIDLHKRYNPNEQLCVPFAGKLIICGGDLRQCLTITKHADRPTIVGSIMNRSPLWTHFKELHLAENERVMRNAQNCTEREKDLCKSFAKELLSLGDGDLESFDERSNTVDISKIVRTNTTLETTLKDFVLWCYPELSANHPSQQTTSTAVVNEGNISIYDKAILCALNEEADLINSIAVELLEGQGKEYLSVDEIDPESDKAKDIPIEFLNSLRSGGFPPHKLYLKPGSPVILLRNLNPSLGLCNGTKMIIKRLLGQYSIEVEIVSGSNKGAIIPLPRIDLVSSESDFPFIMTRRQFPIRLAFAMTINKSQGQSLKRVGVYLSRPVFSHGQLYVAFSRAGIPWETRCLLEPQEGEQGKVENSKSGKTAYVTKNIVYKEVFRRPL
jgi:hypothetical protein